MNVWPLTAEPALSIGGVQLAEIAERFGTPAHVLDEEHLPSRSFAGRLTKIYCVAMSADRGR